MSQQGREAAGASSARDQSGSSGQQEGARSQSSAAQRAAGTQPASQGEPAGNAEAIKADIQQLLKEVSGQLETLQRELAKEPPPAPGTTADPTLYDSAMPLEPPVGGALPMELATDEAAATRPRTGGDVGRASPTATRAAPQTAPEDAPLTETPQEETGAHRQPVPLEYRDAFDRLNRQQTKP